jgi:ABC-type multidrug transport system fused ATPase/permease subunit
MRSVLGSVIAGHRRSAAALLVTALFAGLTESTILALVAQAATALVEGSDQVVATLGPVQLDARIPTILAVAGGLAVVRLGLHVGVAYLPSRMAGDRQAQIRRELFDAYSRSEWATQADERDGHLQELLTNQIGQATQALNQTGNLFAAGSTFLTLVLSAFLLGPVVALVVLLTAACLAAGLRPLGRRARRHSAALSASLLGYAGAVGETVRLAEETYTFGVADAERGRVNARIDEARHHFVRQQFTSRLAQGVYQGLMILLLVGGLTILYASGTGQIATLGTVVLILVRASSYGQQVQVSWQVIQQAAPFLDRLADTEARYRAAATRSGDAPMPAGGALELQDVSFSYDRGSPVLTDVTLAVDAGTTTGVIGPSGAGKSTLVQLLLRMRHPSGGRLVLAGTPIEEISLEAWHRHVAYVPQEPRLLQATVAENIRFARDISDAEVERAARLAHIHDHILSMPQGYDTPIGQRADAVSGGQRQRICLARALAGAPTVLVLDEPTSALDAASEAAIRDSLLELRGALTMFIVTHQPSLLAVCDQVLRVDAGRAALEPAPTAPHP